MIPVLGVPVLNREDLLGRMIDSIDVPVHHLVIIDNSARRLRISEAWAMDATRGKCRHLWYLRMPSNLGVPASWNLIVKSTPYAPWWLITAADIVFPPGALATIAAESSPDAVLTGGCHPDWAWFTVGETVVDTVGLFDEQFHPIYFEDNDYARRCALAGIDVRATTATVYHDNSSTIAAGYAGHNNRTFDDNRAFYMAKHGGGPGAETRATVAAPSWSLARRRALGWDQP